VEFGGLSIEIESTVPEGAGLSSSAALEVATITALNEVFGLSLTDEERYRLSQRAENEFVGVQCGIMDQFASVMGRQDSAIFLDTVSMEYEYLPLELGAYSLVVFDSKVHHELLSGGYNSRRRRPERPWKYSARGATGMYRWSIFSPPDQKWKIFITGEPCTWSPRT
jgi:galactokinase